MKISLGFKKRSVMITSILGCMAFVASAIFAWDLPVEKALNFLVLCFVLVLLIVAASFITVFVIKQIRRLF